MPSVPQKINRLTQRINLIKSLVLTLSINSVYYEGEAEVICCVQLTFPKCTQIVLHARS